MNTYPAPRLCLPIFLRMLLLVAAGLWPVLVVSQVVYTADFASDTPGQQPTGNWGFSPGSNSPTNGSMIVDAGTSPANPLGSGQSLYVYDLDGDGSSGTSTHLRTDFLAGEHLSAARVSFDFQPMYTVGAEDSDTRVHFSIGRSGLSMNNSDFRLFEIRMQNNGGFRVEYSRDGAGGDRGSSEDGTFDPSQPSEVILYLNSHGSETVSYDDGTNVGELAPNMMDVYLNGNYIGSYLTLRTPDPANAPQIDFWASDADLGQIAFFQDTRRQGGLVVDNIEIQNLGSGGGELPGMEVYLDNYTFAEDSVGERPVLPFATAYTPSSNTTGNGFVIIDATTDPANTMESGQALYAYDLVGDGNSGESSHLRFDFAPDNTDNVRVDFDFQRAYAVPVEDEDTRVHVAVAPAGSSTNNSDFRPFEIRILNNGGLVVNYNPTGAELDGQGSDTVAQYNTTGANRLTFFANGNNGDSLPYDDEVLGQGTVPANAMVLFLNGTKIGEYGFLNTPDSANAPQIAFFETTKDFGRFAIYQDSKRQGGIIFDNLSIQNFAVLGAPDAPTGLIATATGPDSIQLGWTDNSGSETGFVIEQKDASSWVQIATVDANATSYDVTGLQPETLYTFRVFSTNGTLSEPSNESSATTAVQLLPIVTVEPEDQLIPSASEVTLSVEATGPGTLSYQWYVGDTGDTSNPVSGATSNSFTTPSVSATTAYWVRLSNANGFADSRSAIVEVFVPRTIPVSSLAQLRTLLPAALPGDTYVIASGTYPNAQISFEGFGSKSAPITLQAEVAGEVVFTGDSNLRIGGDWLVVEGFLFTDGWNQSLDQVISFRTSSRPARNSRVTQCAIINFSPSDPSIDRDWIGMYGSNNRFDHNYIAGHSNKGVTLVVWRNPGIADHHLIDNNHFAFRASGGGENGWETLRIGTSSDSLSASRTTVEYNLFEECNGEIEIISNKSGENVYRYNTFLRCDGMLTLRHGDDCIVEGNVFLGEGVAGSGGIRVIGENHTIINNYIERTTGRAGAAIVVYAGVQNSPLNRYFVADGTFIGNNTIVDVSGAHLSIGAGFGTADFNVLPTGVVVTNNQFAQWARSAVDGPVITGPAATDALYAGNLYDAIIPLGFESLNGMSAANLPFEEGPFGLLRPTAASPAIDAADAAYPIALDLDGQARGSNQDVGADEATEVPGINPGGYLRPDQVGPAWLAGRLPWQGDNVLAGDQIASPWFGSFLVSTEGWLQHAQLGWINVDSTESVESMWIYSQFLNSWIWSRNDLFPIVYDSGSQRWSVYVVIEDTSGYYFDYTTSTWVVIP